jgi:hypothetical protein
VAGCTAELVDLNPAPVFQNVNAACFITGRDDELQLTNSGGFESHNASIILAKTFDGGMFTDNGNIDFNLGYAYSDAEDRRNMYSSTAGSNYDLSAAFDRQNPEATRGFYSSKHNITSRLAFREEFFDDLSTRLAFTFVARSGRPYSLTFQGTGIFNDSASGSDNALAYLPTGPSDPNISPSSNMYVVQQLADFAASLDCAKDSLGQTIERNTCDNDWYYDMDLSFSQEIPGPGRLFGRGDKIKLYATMDNFLNFLDSSWNIQRRRNFSGLQDVVGLTGSGFDSAGRYIIGPLGGACPSAAAEAAPNRTCFTIDENFRADNLVNQSSSIWRLKIGVSYEF